MQCNKNIIKLCVISFFQLTFNNQLLFSKDFLMHHSTIQLKKATYFGITVRTSNTDEMNPVTAKIPTCIQRFYGEKLYEKIANPVNPAVAIGAYTNYVSDHTDEYTYFIGMEVAENAECPAQLEKLVVPAGTYAEFTTETGKMPDILIAVWQKIWQMDSKDFGGKRAYKVDFELYNQAATDFNNIQSKIYIGLQK